MNTVEVDISRALPITGWMTEPELLWLAEQASQHQRIVEVGSHAGRSTRVLADNTFGWVLAFDDWRGPRDVHLLNDQHGNVIATARIEWHMPALLDSFRRNLEDHLKSGRVVMLQGDHGDTSILPPEFVRGKHWERPDMVFIDGSHEYEDVKRDILIWKTRLIPGGLLCGHDAERDEIKAALNVTLPSGYVVCEGTNIWKEIT